MRVLNWLCVIGVVCGLCLAAVAAPDAGPAATQPAVSAPAVTAPPQPILGELIDAAIKIVLGALGVLAAWLVHKVAVFVSEKLKVSIPAGIEDQVDAWVTQGIGLAEEKAHQAVQAGSAKMTGPEKLEAAADYVWKLVEAHNLTTYTRDLVVAKLTAALGVDRKGE